LDPKLVWFDSGWGDGHYPVRWGLDAVGRRTCIATDFGLFQKSPLAVARSPAR
jgi:hypothetical protein